MGVTFSRLSILSLLVLLSIATASAANTITFVDQSNDWHHPYAISYPAQYSSEYFDFDSTYDGTFDAFYAFNISGTGSVTVGATHIQEGDSVLIRLLDPATGNLLSGYSIDSKVGSFSNVYAEATYNKQTAGRQTILVQVHLTYDTNKKSQTNLTLYTGGTRPPDCSTGYTNTYACTWLATHDTSDDDWLSQGYRNPNCQITYNNHYFDCGSLGSSFQSAPYCDASSGKLVQTTYSYYASCDIISNSCYYLQSMTSPSVSTRTADTCGGYGCSGNMVACLTGSTCTDYQQYSESSSCSVDGSSSCTNTAATCNPPVCGDNTCDTARGETASSCPADCGPNTCSSDSDCSSDERCDFSRGVCTPKGDECSTPGAVSCSAGSVVQCTQNSNGRLVNTTLQNCNQLYKTCDPATVATTKSCSTTSLNPYIDYTHSRIVVNKQPGDKLFVHLDVSSAQNATLDYDPLKLTTNCSATWNLSAGENTCAFNVRSVAPSGESTISVDGIPLRFNVIRKPDTLLFTHVPALEQRYPNGSAKILAAAYASVGDRGVVYDLSQYETMAHPFGNYSSYHESSDSLNFSANDYASWADAFIRSKTPSQLHTDVMILGDDYVVPGYRRKLASSERVFFSKKDTTYHITTDVGAISKSGVGSNDITFATYGKMFTRNGKYQGKHTSFIMPSNASAAQIDAMKRLNATFFANGYDPTVLDPVDGSTVTCFDNRFRGQALVIIGTEKTNPVFNCLPFVDNELDGIYILPSPFDPNNYALVIHSDDPVIINQTVKLFENGEIYNLRTTRQYQYKVTTNVLAFTALGVAIVATAPESGTAAATTLSAAAAGTGILADGAFIADSCFVNKESNTVCGVSATIGVIGIGANVGLARSVLKSLKTVEESTVPSWFPALRPYFNDLEESGVLWNSRLIRQGLLSQDEMRQVAEGAEEFLSKSGRSSIGEISSFKQISADDVVLTLRDTGALKENGALFGKGFIRSVANDASDTGRLYEIRNARNALDRGETVTALGADTLIGESDLTLEIGGKYLPLETTEARYSRKKLIKDLSKLRWFTSHEYPITVADPAVEGGSLSMQVAPTEGIFSSTPEFHQGIVDKFATGSLSSRTFTDLDGNTVVAQYLAGEDAIQLADESGNVLTIVHLRTLEGFK